MEFLWTLPCYVIAKNATFDPLTGALVLDERIRFITPEMGLQNERRLAIFTDSDLADDYRDKLEIAGELAIIPVESRSELLRLLLAARSNYRRVVIDLYPKTQIGRVFETGDVIHGLRSDIDSGE